MQLDDAQKNELAETIEEEIREMNMYKNLGLSEVCVFQMDGYDVYIKVVSEDFPVEETEEDE